MLVYININKSKAKHSKLFIMVILSGRMVDVKDLVFSSHVFLCCLNFYRMYYYS